MIGPLGFIAAWVLGALLTSQDYSSIDDAISRLAARSADTQLLMTAGFIVFGVAVPMYAVALRRGLQGWAWLSATATGVATLGVAAAPLEYSPAIDLAHNIAAGIGYVSLAITPWLAYRPLRKRGAQRLAIAGLVAGGISALCLAASVGANADGLFQRAGLTSTDLWLMASAVWLGRSSGKKAG